MRARQNLILIVEDEPDDIHFLVRAFRKAKVEVPLYFAADGVIAIEYLAQISAGDPCPAPTMVLLDLKLPRKSGFEVLEWIRQHSRLRLVPIVILTSSRESADIRRAYELGANSYLVKPVRPRALLEIVSQIHAYWLSLNEPPASPETPAE